MYLIIIYTLLLYLYTILYTYIIVFTYLYIYITVCIIIYISYIQLHLTNQNYEILKFNAKAENSSYLNSLYSNDIPVKFQREDHATQNRNAAALQSCGLLLFH